MKYTYYNEETEQETGLKIDYLWYPEQKSDGLTCEHIPAGFDEIYAINPDGKDIWNELPGHVQDEIERKLDRYLNEMAEV